MKPYVSSYAAASPVEPWDREAEEELFDGLSRLDLAGLELPYTGRLHRHDDAWLIDRLRPQWNFILTLLPGTMERLKTDPLFGLASADADGRRRALDFAESARRTVEHLNGFLGRPAVRAVELHSSPKLGVGAKASLEAFADSLILLRGLDWQGAELFVEHCDAAVPGQEAEKGFLRLEDECTAIKLSQGPTPAKILLNWARSAIETRSTEGPLEHMRRAKEAELLGGLFFSGCTRSHPDYGSWKDSHAPFSSSCPKSLLTPEAVKAALREAGELDVLGVKIQPLPASLRTGARLTMIAGALADISAGPESLPISIGRLKK